MKKRDRVVNQPEIEAFISEFYTDNPKINNWLLNMVAKNDIPNGVSQDKENPYMKDTTLPDGKRGFIFTANDTLTSFLHTTVDFLEKALANDETVMKVVGPQKLKSIQNLKAEGGFSAAHIGAFANKWQAYLRNQHSTKAADHEEEVVMEFKDGCKMVKLCGKNAILREGKRQDNCLGQKEYSYGDDENASFYSLRSPDNRKILATLFVYKGVVSETKSKGNSSVEEKYAPHLREFVKALDLKVHMDKYVYKFTSEELKTYGTTKDPVSRAPLTLEQIERRNLKFFNQRN